MGYDNDVRTKWPCPEGYEELNGSEEPGTIIYDRTLLKSRRRIVGFSGTRHVSYRKNDGHTFTTSTCWFIKKSNDWTVGESVSAEAEDGYIVEGNVVEIVPYGCPFIDPTWTEMSIVIQDHETKHLSYWRPEKVTKCGTHVS